MFKRIALIIIISVLLAGNIVAFIEGANIHATIRDDISTWVDSFLTNYDKTPDINLKAGSNNQNSNVLNYGIDSNTKKSPPFKIAFNTWLGYSPLVWAREKGFLKEEGLAVEITFLEGIAEKNSSLIRGSIDGVGHTADSAVISASVGVEGQIIYVFDKSFGADGILSDNSIKTIEDLKGKRVALEPGFTGHFFFLTLMDEVGLSGDDVEIIEMDTGSAGSSFVSGKIDAAVTWEPWIGKAKERENAHILVTSADRPGLIIDVLYMRKETINNRQKDVDSLIRAMGKATKWYLQNKNEGNQIMADFWKLSMKEVRETVNGIKFMIPTENEEFFGTNKNPGALLNTVNNANNLWFRSGVTKNLITDTNNLIYYRNQVVSKSPTE